MTPNPNTMRRESIDIALQWKDLVALRRWEVALNLGLSAPWLGAALWLAHHDQYLLAAPCSAAFFLTALRQAHDSYHASIRRAILRSHVFVFLISEESIAVGRNILNTICSRA